jgi:hypothetical protein
MSNLPIKQKDYVFVMLIYGSSSYEYSHRGNVIGIDHDVMIFNDTDICDVVSIPLYNIEYIMCENNKLIYTTKETT